MQRIYDTLVGLSFLAFLAVGGWTGPVWQMAVILMALLAIMAWSGWMGGYIMGTERHRRAIRGRRRPSREVLSNPCYYCLSSQGDDCQDTCEAYQRYLSMLDQYCKGKDEGNGDYKTDCRRGVTPGHIS